MKGGFAFLFQVACMHKPSTKNAVLPNCFKRLQSLYNLEKHTQSMNPSLTDDTIMDANTL